MPLCPGPAILMFKWSWTCPRFGSGHHDCGTPKRSRAHRERVALRKWRCRKSRKLNKKSAKNLNQRMPLNNYRDFPHKSTLISLTCGLFRFFWAPLSFTASRSLRTRRGAEEFRFKFTVRPGPGRAGLNSVPSSPGGRGRRKGPKTFLGAGKFEVGTGFRTWNYSSKFGLELGTGRD